MPFTALQLNTILIIYIEFKCYRYSHAVHGIATIRCCINISHVSSCYRYSHAVHGIATSAAEEDFGQIIDVTGIVMPFTALQRNLSKGTHEVHVRLQV